MTARLSSPVSDGVHARQIAFFAAFILPVYKMVEAPSILANYAQGDLLLPALLHYLLQTGLLLALLYTASRSQTTLFERLQARLKGWSAVLYLFYALFYLFYAVLPLLDLEKFTYAAFYDTAPTLFSFSCFFLLLAFVCAKGIKSLARCADICLFLFLIPFLALTAMALIEADFSGLLPLFEKPFGHTVYAFTNTTPHFSDVVLLLPLICNLRYKKGDGKKIVAGYGAGALFTLFFLAVFYGVYSTVAPRQHYAFAKIAQYFPALSVIGRIDLLLVYVLCAVLFFFTCTPMTYAVDLAVRTFGENKRTVFAAAIALVAFVFTLFCNKYYNAIYAAVGGMLYPVFWLIADLLPLALLLLKGDKEKRDGKPEKQQEERNAETIRSAPENGETGA